MRKEAVLIAIVLSFSPAYADTSVSQYGITWQFDSDHETGQFANGDYWVKGPVTITRITPDFTGTLHGWEVNPKVAGGQGFDSRISDFQPALVPALPYSASPGDSIVKFISDDPANPSQDRVFGKAAGILTVVSEAPPGQGSQVFRPPYMGDAPSKRTSGMNDYYYASALRTDLIPSITPTSGVRAALYPIRGTGGWGSSAEATFKRPQIVHKDGALGRSIRPSDNLYDYQPTNMVEWNRAMLRIMLDDSLEDKMPAIIGITQAGIDIYHSIKGGNRYGPGGGHNPGYSLVLSFAAVMLDDPGMRLELSQADYFWEQMYIKESLYGIELWGDPTTSESSYWVYVNNGGGSRSARDPYGYIDGGSAPGTAYQLIVSQPFKGQALAFILMPAMNDIFDQEKLIMYSDRWVNMGKWSQPDPCAPPHGICVGGASAGQTCFPRDGCPGGTCDITGRYQVTYGPNASSPGMCILDPDLEYYNNRTDFACKAGKSCGRYPEAHGTAADTGSRDSAFQRAMWEAYRGDSCYDGICGADDCGYDCGCIADADGNGKVDMPDLISVVSSWVRGDRGMKELMEAIHQWKHGC